MWVVIMDDTAKLLTMHLHQLDCQPALLCDGSQDVLKTIVVVEFELAAVILLDDHVVVLNVECIQLCVGGRVSLHNSNQAYQVNYL